MEEQGETRGDRDENARRLRGGCAEVARRLRGDVRTCIPNGSSSMLATMKRA